MDFEIDFSDVINHLTDTLNQVIAQLITLTLIVAASSFRMLRWYPETQIAIGSPSGAMRVTLIISPGMQPISNSFSERS